MVVLGSVFCEVLRFFICRTFYINMKYMNVKREPGYPCLYVYSDSVTGWKSGFPIPTRSARFAILPHVQTGAGSHPASYSVGTGVLCRGHEFDQCPPSSADVKNEWIYAHYSPILFHVLVRNHFDLT